MRYTTYLATDAERWTAQVCEELLDVLHHSVELQSQITRHVERSQIVLKGNACESEIPKGSFFKED